MIRETQIKNIRYHGTLRIQRRIKMIPSYLKIWQPILAKSAISPNSLINGRPTNCGLRDFNRDARYAGAQFPNPIRSRETEAPPSCHIAHCLTPSGFTRYHL